PLLQSLEMNFGVEAPQTGDVGLEARLVEPAKHLVELPAQEEPHEQHRQFPEVHRPAEDTTEDLRRLRISQLATGNLEFESDEVFWALKSQGGKGANVGGGDRLVWLVGADGVHKLPLQNADFNLIDVIILHKGGRSEDRCRQTEFANVLLDLPLAVP